MELSDNDFKIIQTFIYEKCGIVIGEEKKYLIHQRLEPIAQLYSCKTFSQFCASVLNNGSDKIRTEIINAITTNETSFFRDIHPFCTLQNHMLPAVYEKIKNKLNKNIRIWSAGSSTGQEAYSIAMIIAEFTQNNKLSGMSTDNFSIIASDISLEIITKAKTGKYNETEISRGLSQERLNKYFTLSGNMWEISDDLKKRVKFLNVNFINPFTILGFFDIIFCRNVLIYFDDKIKKKIFEQFYQMLSNDGFLILGSTENIYNITNKFDTQKHRETTFYKKKV